MLALCVAFTRVQPRILWAALSHPCCKTPFSIFTPLRYAVMHFAIWYYQIPTLMTDKNDSLSAFDCTLALDNMLERGTNMRRGSCHEHHVFGLGYMRQISIR
ncbi:hypothetical protein FVEG_15356 [Fusarium verticillioides 7600]|uniref:Uncharacterized protein n=1 Tax=Gibberella moniliformis (strain M3125 / FGSC 7600) TaxID=334819 RepID=W7M306_GIBM7|nr:hypothetical protein FVEG_15356 [Fusarium verticillioides 7600]EWG41904.1 hypothetical protein FVEG_15356 [Fusarium verticillioides 7600]